MNVSLFNMKDYSKTIIYKIVCNITGEVYYGHTTMTLEDRMDKHVSKGNECTSKKIIERGDYEAIEIEKYPCANKKEACRREGWYMLNNPHVNEKIAGRTVHEYKQTPEYQEKARARCRLYYHSHEEKERLRKKMYNKENKEKIQLYRDSHKEHKNAYTTSVYNWLKSWDGGSRRRGLNQIAVDLFD